MTCLSVTVLRINMQATSAKLPKSMVLDSKNPLLTQNQYRAMYLYIARWLIKHESR